MSTYNKKKNTDGGYALYTAIILTGVLILVAYATANLSVEQLLLSTSGSESHIAFYNADTGLECALMADVKNGSISAFDNTTPGTVRCNGQTITTGNETIQTTPTQASRVGGGGSNSSSIFQINIGTGCAIVTVTKNVVAPNTIIQSRGYNLCSGSRRLERGVTIQY